MKSAIDAAIGHFNNGRYFEAHECLEDLWRPADGDLRDVYQGLIQICAGLVKHQRGQPGPAATLLRKGIGRVEAVVPAACAADLDAPALLAGLRAVLAAIETGRPFDPPVMRRRPDV